MGPSHSHGAFTLGRLRLRWRVIGAQRRRAPGDRRLRCWRLYVSTVGRQLVNGWSTVGRQLVDSWSTGATPRRARGAFGLWCGGGVACLVVGVGYVADGQVVHLAPCLPGLCAAQPRL
eukprot:5787091-Pyramimonas_sp.AAC.1